jgi:hypothetical protein
MKTLKSLTLAASVLAMLAAPSVSVAAETASTITATEQAIIDHAAQVADGKMTAAHEAQLTQAMMQQDVPAAQLDEIKSQMSQLASELKGTGISQANITTLSDLESHLKAKGVSTAKISSIVSLANELSTKVLGESQVAAADVVGGRTNLPRTGANFAPALAVILGLAGLTALASVATVKGRRTIA